MPIQQKHLADFNEQCIYHIFNRTNNNELLFKSNENKIFFLKQHSLYLSPYLDTFAWCLLPNHFRFLVRIKAENSIHFFLKNSDEHSLTTTEKKFITKEIPVNTLIQQSFKRFFQSYAQSFNKVYNRKGNLFYKPFKRLLIEKETHFTQVIIYIHGNPCKQKLIKDFTRWEWSSWNSLLSESPTQLLREETIHWFGGKDQFIKIHCENIEYFYNNDTAIED